MDNDQEIDVHEEDDDSDEETGEEARKRWVFLNQEANESGKQEAEPDLDWSLLMDVEDTPQALLSSTFVGTIYKSPQRGLPLVYLRQLIHAISDPQRLRTLSGADQTLQRKSLHVASKLLLLGHESPTLLQAIFDHGLLPDLSLLLLRRRALTTGSSSTSTSRPYPLPAPNSQDLFRERLEVYSSIMMKLLEMSPITLAFMFSKQPRPPGEEEDDGKRVSSLPGEEDQVLYFIELQQHLDSEHVVALLVRLLTNPQVFAEDTDDFSLSTEGLRLLLSWLTSSAQEHTLSSELNLPDDTSQTETERENEREKERERERERERWTEHAWDGAAAILQTLQATLSSDPSTPLRPLLRCISLVALISPTIFQAIFHYHDHSPSSSSSSSSSSSDPTTNHHPRPPRRSSRVEGLLFQGGLRTLIATINAYGFVIPQLPAQFYPPEADPLIQIADGLADDNNLSKLYQALRTPPPSPVELTSVEIPETFGGNRLLAVDFLTKIVGQPSALKSPGLQQCTAQLALVIEAALDASFCYPRNNLLHSLVAFDLVAPLLNFGSGSGSGSYGTEEEETVASEIRKSLLDPNGCDLLGRISNLFPSVEEAVRETLGIPLLDKVEIEADENENEGAARWTGYLGHLRILANLIERSGCAPPSDFRWKRFVEGPLTLANLRNESPAEMEVFTSFFAATNELEELLERF
eukprot:TRINITY_DN376_c0_g1_i1.p1 TRINITY_DN376_c0_g1~~TRINITY_DN376_c0_g1_i1.p1  ORF type:complete len:694 (+),score=198.37 TRINITY_DN376_c0_g1_i1:97-2178(+)